MNTTERLNEICRLFLFEHDNDAKIICEMLQRDQKITKSNLSERGIYLSGELADEVLDSDTIQQFQEIWRATRTQFHR